MPVSLIVKRTVRPDPCPAATLAPQDHFAHGGELDGVAEQVGENLAQPAPGLPAPPAAGHEG